MTGKKIAKIALLTVATSVPIIWYFVPYSALLWGISWYALTILMTIRPLAQLCPNEWNIRQWISFRKELGILSASVVLTAALYKYVPMGGDFFRYFIFDHWNGSFTEICGKISELVAVPLMLTSNVRVQRVMKKWWKRVQRFSHLYFYSAGIYLFSIGKNDAMVCLCFVAAITISAAIKTKKRH